MKSEALKRTAEHGAWQFLSRFCGQVVAVDVSCWLYLAMSVSTEWYTAGSGGDVESRYESVARFVLRRAETLVAAGIKPFFVLDGEPLPGKSGEAESRATRRAAAAIALQCHMESDGSAFDDEGKAYLKQMQGRSAPLTRLLTKRLAVNGYSFLVAPYEAVHQVVFLERIGVASAVLTGDGDLFVLGAKTVIYDYSGKRLARGRCFVVRQQDVLASRVFAARADDDVDAWGNDEYDNLPPLMEDQPDDSQSGWETVDEYDGVSATGPCSSSSDSEGGEDSADGGSGSEAAEAGATDKLL
jgi:5'-3' exonuclease